MILLTVLLLAAAPSDLLSNGNFASGLTGWNVSAAAGVVRTRRSSMAAPWRDW